MRLGELQTLQILRKVDFGVYLGENKGDAETVLLPKKQVPAGAGIGDEIRVFVYKDSKDRPIATTTVPKVTVGNYGVMTVKEVGKIGAFLDWGLEKDLLLPFHEMRGRVEAKDEILVRVYVDKSGRLAASMRGLYHMLSTRAPYQAGDEVNGRIYEFGHDFGTFVAVDDHYSAMIPRFEDCSHLRIGDVITGRVTQVKEDGKLDLSIRREAYEQIDEDAESLLMLIDEFAGVLPFTEKASPEVILRETGLSKAAFKRAVGRLYKEHKITLEGGKIRKV